MKKQEQRHAAFAKLKIKYDNHKEKNKPKEFNTAVQALLKELKQNESFLIPAAEATATPEP